MAGRSLAFAVVAGIVVLVLRAGAAPIATAADLACKGTRPNHVVAPGASFGRAAFNYGNADLRVHLNWSDGMLRAGALPDGGLIATIEDDGSIRTKQGWWRGREGSFVITGRRLDGRAAPLRAIVHLGAYGARGFVPSTLIFSTPGCWLVEARLATTRIRYTVRVVVLRN